MTPLEAVKAQELSYFKLRNIMGLIKALCLISISVLGILVSLTDKMDKVDTNGWLYKTLGLEGLRLIGAGIFVLGLIAGCIWAYKRIHSLRIGLEADKDEKGERITSRPYDM
jgi:hypothetical protein